MTYLSVTVHILSSLHTVAHRDTWIWLTYEWHSERGGWHYLWYQQQEHSERQQHWDAQRHLLPAIRWQVEHQDSQRRDQHTRDDQVNGVKQRLPLDHKIISDIQVGDVIGVLVFAGRQRDDVPLSTWCEVITAGKVAREDEIHLCVVVGPGAELESAVLLVEGEVLHLDGAGRLVNGRGKPEDVSCVGDHSIAIEGNLVHAISTVRGCGWDVRSERVRSLKKHLN